MITKKRAVKFYILFFLIRVSLDLPNNFHIPVATHQFSTFGLMKLELFSRTIQKFTSNRTLLNIRFRKRKNLLVDGIIKKNSWNQRKVREASIRHHRPRTIELPTWNFSPLWSKFGEKMGRKLFIQAKAQKAPSLAIGWFSARTQFWKPKIL